MPEEKHSLNYFRYHYFLDPCGTNREIFEQVVPFLTTSLLNWYLPGEDLQQERRAQDFFAGLIKCSKSEDQLLRIFEGREKIRAKKSVPDRQDPQELEERFELNVKKVKFPERSHPLEEVILDLDRHTDPSIRFNQYFNGEMHPHDNIPAFAASIVSKFLNANAIAQCVSPSITYMETLVTRWMADLIGYDHSKKRYANKGLSPEEQKKIELIPSGNIVSGGTVANHTALLIARNKLLHLDGPEESKGVAEEGILKYSRNQDISDLVMFCSKEAHYSIEKLAGYVGIGSTNVIKIDTDEQGRMRTDLLEKEIEKAKGEHKKIVAIVATAGTTGCGAIDPLAKIADIAEREKIYLHVDAAHGGGFLTSQWMRSKFAGIERADSVTIDGHKMLYTNYSCGGIIFKDKLDPIRFLKQSAKYILDKDTPHYNLGKSTLEGSRSTDGTLQLYASIVALGREGYELITQHTVSMTQYLHGAVKRSPVLEPFHNPEMNVLCFRYVPQEVDSYKNINKINRLNIALNQAIYADGEFYLGDTEMERDGQKCKVQRAIIMHPYVETYDLDRLVRRVEELGHKLKERVTFLK